MQIRVSLTNANGDTGFRDQLFNANEPAMVVNALAEERCSLGLKSMRVFNVSQKCMVNPQLSIGLQSGYQSETYWKFMPYYTSGNAFLLKCYPDGYTNVLKRGQAITMFHSKGDEAITTVHSSRQVDLTTETVGALPQRLLEVAELEGAAAVLVPTHLLLEPASRVVKQPVTRPIIEALSLAMHPLSGAAEGLKQALRCTGVRNTVLDAAAAPVRIEVWRGSNCLECFLQGALNPEATVVEAFGGDEALATLQSFDIQLVFVQHYETCGTRNQHSSTAQEREERYLHSPQHLTSPDQNTL